MAEVVGHGNVDNSKYWRHTWADMANGDTGKPVRSCGHVRQTVMVYGTFGTGGSVSIEGSMDGDTWATVDDSNGTAIAVEAAGIVTLGDGPRFLRPNVTAGDGTTSLTVEIGAYVAV